MLSLSYLGSVDRNVDVYLYSKNGSRQAAVFAVYRLRFARQKFFQKIFPPTPVSARSLRNLWV